MIEGNGDILGHEGSQPDFWQPTTDLDDGTGENLSIQRALARHLNTRRAPRGLFDCTAPVTRGGYLRLGRRVI